MVRANLFSRISHGPGLVALLLVFTLLAIFFTVYTPPGQSATLKIIVPQDLYNGHAGSVQVSIIHPAGIEVASAILDPQGDTIIEVPLDILLIESGLEELGGKWREGYLTTVTVTLYLSWASGKCIASWSMDNYEYLAQKLGDEDALEASREDPLAILRAGTLKVDRISCHDVTEALRNAAKIGGGGHVKPWDADTETRYTGRCAPIYVEIANPVLYRERASPPQIWMDRLQADDSIKHVLWEEFAERFSLSYYFSLSCSDYDIQLAMHRLLGISEGTKPVEHALGELYRSLGHTGGLEWADEYGYMETVKNYDQAPIVILENMGCLAVNCIVGDDPDLVLTLGSPGAGVETRGIGVFGVLALAAGYLSEGMDVQSVSNDIDDYGYIGAIYSRASLVYLYDMMTVIYYKQVDTIHGEQVWKVTPLYIMYPGYLIDYDTNSVNVVRGPKSDPLVSRILSAHEELATPYGEWGGTSTIDLYWNELPPPGYTTDSIILDNPGTMDIRARGLGGLATLLLNNAIGSAASLAESPLTHDLASLDAASINVVISDMYYTGLDIELSVIGLLRMDYSTYAGVNKATISGELLASDYEYTGYPLSFKYIFSIWEPYVPLSIQVTPGSHT